MYTGPKIGVLVLDVDEPAKFRKWIGASAADLGPGSLVSYHRQDSPDAVRSGAAKGKLIFKFEADDSHPLARVGKAALRQPSASRSSTATATPASSANTRRAPSMTTCSPMIPWGRHRIG